MQNQLSRKKGSVKKWVLSIIIMLGILVSSIVIFKADILKYLESQRDKSEIKVAKLIVKGVKNSLDLERQKRILRGNFTMVTDVGDSKNVFDTFHVGSIDTKEKVLDKPIASESKKFHWRHVSEGTIYFCLTDACSEDNETVQYEIIEGKFVCKDAENKSSNCSFLE